LNDTTPVPFVINNDGVLSRQAAELLFTSLVEAEKTAPLEPRIFVLELGIGVGLFARFFLDAFKALCAQHAKNYYRRLTYVAGDRSERMLAGMGFSPTMRGITSSASSMRCRPGRSLPATLPFPPSQGGEAHQPCS
jgi:hypothetical protein